MYIQEYVSKRRGPSIQIIGTREEFHAAEIETEGCQTYKNAGGVEKLTLKGKSDDTDHLKNIAKAKAYIESSEAAEAENVGDWFFKREDSQMMLEALLTWQPKEKLKLHLMKEAGGLSTADAKKLFSLMYEEAMVDANGLLTRDGLKKLAEIEDMKRLMSQ